MGDWNTGDLPKAAKKRLDLVSEWMWKISDLGLIWQFKWNFAMMLVKPRYKLIDRHID